MQFISSLDVLDTMKKSTNQVKKRRENIKDYTEWTNKNEKMEM